MHFAITTALSLLFLLNASGAILYALKLIRDLINSSYPLSPWQYLDRYWIPLGAMQAKRGHVQVWRRCVEAA
jgi:hypothetical protein